MKKLKMILEELEINLKIKNKTLKKNKWKIYKKMNKKRKDIGNLINLFS